MEKSTNKDLHDSLTQSAQFKRYLSRNAQNEEEAADIYQESVARVLEQARNKVIDNPLAYAMRVARNLLIRRPEGTEEDVESIGVVHNNPENVLDRQQRIEMVYQALSNMPTQRRRVFELRRIQGESRQAIAQKLGISVEAVTRHISRAMADIQIHLETKN